MFHRNLIADHIVSALLEKRYIFKISSLFIEVEKNCNILSFHALAEMNSKGAKRGTKSCPKVPIGVQWCPKVFR